jgi:putative DNA primase/helicase
VDPSLRPDLAFPDDLDEEEEPVEDVEAQAEELGCTSLVKGLKEADDRFDWLKDNLKRVAKLEPLEMARLREAWGKGIREFDKVIKKAKTRSAPEGGQMFDYEDWSAVGEAFTTTEQGIVYTQETFYVYGGNQYKKKETEAVAMSVNQYMKNCYFNNTEGDAVAIRPNVGRVANAVQQVKFATMREGIEPRTWTDTGAVGGIPFKNGILLGEELLPHTPSFFATYCLTYDFEPSAECPTWEKVVTDWLDDDMERVELLRQWLRYLIEGRQDVQKIWVLTGVPRSGKGTITSLVRMLLGADNCAAPLMSQFASDFGLENCVGKQAIIIGDAHVKKGDPAGILDKLKSISGKDVIQVNRKNKSQVDCVLGQIVLACNDMADIPDESNALISRYSILNFKKSFVGKEDPELLMKLGAELSGIYNWAMKAERVKRFEETQEEKDLKEGLIASSNPVRSWARSHCEEEKGAVMSKDAFYNSYEKWCEEMHAPRKAKGAFFKTLYQIFPYAKEERKREGGTRVRVIEGISLNDCESEMDFDDNEQF